MHHDYLSGSVISIGSGIDARTRSIIDQSVRRDKETVNVEEGGGVGLAGVGGLRQLPENWPVLRWAKGRDVSFST